MRMNKVGHLNEMIRRYFVKVRHTAFLTCSVHSIIHRVIAEWFLAAVSMVLKSYITQYEKIKLSQGKNIQNGEHRTYTCIIDMFPDYSIFFFNLDFKLLQKMERLLKTRSRVFFSVWRPAWSNFAFRVSAETDRQQQEFDTKLCDDRGLCPVFTDTQGVTVERSAFLGGDPEEALLTVLSSPCPPASRKSETGNINQVQLMFYKTVYLLLSNLHDTWGGRRSVWPFEENRLDEAQ